MNAYGFFAATGGLTTLLWLHRRHAALGLTENEFWAALWLMLAGAVIGAKGMFVVLGWPHFARGELRFWGDFATGFVFFGGLWGALLVGAAFAWWRGVSFWRGADYFAVALPLGHAIGRVGCYFRGCCGGHPPHPVQLYESAGLLGIAWISYGVLRRVEAGRFRRGAAFASYLFLYGLLRLGLDPLRADGRPERWWGFSSQQGLAVAVLIFGPVGGCLCRPVRPSVKSATPG